MTKLELKEHAISSEDGEVRLYAETKDSEFVLVVPGIRLGALVLAALDAEAKRTSVR